MAKRIQPKQSPGPIYVIDTGAIGRQHLALCLDRDSREVVGLQVAHDVADAVAMALAEAVAAYGIPEVVIVANGPDYLPMARLCQRLGIGIKHVPPYSPEPTRAVERAFRDLRVHLTDLQETAQ
ncbi:MAG TPA: hypothetical protein VD978_33515 [Azospirillum sp.]|nr:hypothetical protein [Azospirillum sp.]